MDFGLILPSYRAGATKETIDATADAAARLGWINLFGSPLAFMGSAWTVGIFTLLALLELVTDQLPNTPARTTAVPLGARIVTGLLSGACVGIAGGG